ncbi:MAG: proprotein convertase P-domain-containing protein [Acidobacteriota bacterium]
MMHARWSAPFLSLLLVVGATPVLGQDAPATSRVPLAEIQQLILPPLDAEALLEEDRRVELEGPAPRRFAQPVEVLTTLDTDGTWETLADGSRLWRMRIQSPGATDLNFGFERFRVPAGATLEVVSELNGFRQGPYTIENVHDHGELWTAMVPGDRAVLELHVPAGAAPAPELRLKQVSHGYRDMFDLFDDPLVPHQGACNIDVICPQGDPWRDQIQSVGVYSFGGGTLCTGTMIMDVPGTLRSWFLTADHCGVTAGNAASMVVYWNFESPTCGALSGGTLDENQTGATLRATWAGSDFSLVELAGPPPDESNVYWAGWDRTDVIPPGSVAIHHPNTDEMAISFNTDPLTYSPTCIGGGGADTHWEVDNWEEGTTEPGSSGSALFDPDNQLLIGTLSGGLASCTLIDYDCYGRFAVSWTGNGTDATRLSNWLDPADEGVMTVDGSYANARVFYASHRLVDACAVGAGGGNGILEPGESVEVWVSLRSTGDLTGVEATLSSASPGVTVTSGTLSWGALGSAETREGAQPFTVMLAEDAPCYDEIDFQLELGWTDVDPMTGNAVFSEVLGVPLEPELPLAFPNNGEAGSDLAVVDSVTLTDVNVRVRLSHTRIGDVGFRLRAPDGTEVVLLDRPGVPATGRGCPDNNMDVTFDDDAVMLLEDHCDGTDPWYVGTAVPTEALSTLVGRDSAGTWTLIASDGRGGPTGVVDEWELITQPPLGGACQPCVDVVDCPGQVTSPDALRLRKGLGGQVILSFDDPPSACALGTSVFVSASARPAMGVGDFPRDPMFIDRTGEDVDPGAEFAHVPPAESSYYLVVESLPAGGYGPSGHYGP